MANNSPTIVAASLDDEKLKASIEQMVQNLNAGLEKMKTSTDAAVGYMQKSLQQLGNTKIDTGGSSDGGASRRARAQNEETEAVKRTTAARKEEKATLDDVAAAMQRAAQPKSARESFYAFEKHFRDQAKSLEPLIQGFEQNLSSAIQRRVNEINSTIGASKLKIQELNQELNRNYASNNKTGVQQTLTAIEREKNIIKEQESALKNVNQEFVAQKMYLTGLVAEHYNLSNHMKDEVVAGQKLTEEERRLQQTTEARRVAIERMSQMSKEDLQATFKQFSSMPATGFDQISNKLEQMKMTVAAMRSSGLFDATELNKAQNSVDNLEKKLKKTPEYAEKLSSSTQHVVEATQRATSASKELIAEEKRAVRESMNNERARSQAIIDSARTAQQEWRRVINDMINNKVMDSGEPIKMSYIKSLEDSFARMKRAWFELSDAERTSPFGMSLINDLIRVKKAMQEIRAYGQNLLGIENVGNNMLTKNSSIESLKNSIKQLTSQYNQLTIEEIRAGKGDALIRKFQETTRAAQVLQKQLSTPLTFADANNIQVRTLDDMAYKLRMLQSYKQGIDVTKPNAAEEINKVDAAITQLKKDMDKYMSSTKAADNATNALTRSLNYMKNRLAFYFTVGASTQFIKNLIEIRSQYEMNERALGILINSAERGSQIFKELSDMALMSPYTLIELSTAAKQLTAYDIAAKDVVDTTRRLADMTAAVGIPIERLTYAIGQVKAYGYLNARDARMFSNAGIPLVKELADYYSKLEGHLVSVADVYDKIKKKAIGYNDVMSVVTKMTDEGGKFFDFQAKMAGTLKVQLANLTLAWNNMLNEFGSSEQGAISSVIGGLKELFLQWKNIDKVIWSVIYAFGLWKVAQLTALALTGNLTGAMAAQVVMGTKLQAKMASMAAGFKSASIGISAAGMAFWLVLGDAIMTYERNAKEVQALNKSIADGAKESAESISKFLESSEIYQNRLNASTGKLPKAEAEKTWEALREQIEMTADSSDEIIAKLLDPKKYDNINDRLTAGFNILESIRNVTEKLSDMFDKLDVSQDTILFGALGEGLAEDIEDYNEKLKYTAEVAEWSAKKNRDFWKNAAMGLSVLFNEVKDSMGNDEEEAKNEIRNFAKSAADVIKDELGEEALGDKIQVNEAIARVIQGMEKQFPQIRGKGKALFETIFNDVMATEFEGAVDKQAYYYNLFLNRLKKDHASAFQDVTDGILDDTHTWNKAQLDAIKKTADKVKEDLPAASQDAINQILNQLNNTEFKLRIVTEFATTTQDEVNKQFRKRFISAPSIMTDEDEREKYETIKLQKYGTLMKKSEESNLEYEDRIRKKREENLKISKDNAKIIEANKNKTDDASKAIVANAEEEKKAADDFLESAKRVEDWGGYDFSTKNENKDASKAQKAASKAQATAEKEVTEAFKNELSVLREMQSAYDKLRKAGVDNTTAIDLASRGYEQTLRRVNATLAKYGISKFNASDFLGKNVNDVLKTLERQRDDALASGKLKSSELKELDVEISKLNVDAKTYNMDKITKGLNNELSKLKDEYELAVELDANPELGDMFASMFGIDTDALPKTFGEAFDRANEIAKSKLRELKVDIDDFDLMSTNIKADADNKWMGIDIDSEPLKEILKWQKTFRDMFKSNLVDTEKMLDEYVKKYGDYSDKIAEIERDRLERIRKLNEAYFTEQMRQSTEYQAKLNAINKGASAEKQKAEFDEFKDSRYYTALFENLDYVSTKTIRDMRDRLRELMDTMHDLTPEQLKQIMAQYEKLEQKLVKRSPFKTLAKDFKAYVKQTKERKAANEAFRNADKEYWSQQKVVASLKEKYEQAKANENTSKSYLEFLQIEINAQSDILDIFKKQLDAAQKKADEYNLTAKLARSEMLAVAQVVGDNMKGLAELRDNLNNLFGIDVGKGETLLGHSLDGLIDGLAKAGDGISKITSGAQSGNVFGVASGVVDVFTGIADGIASIFGDGSARTKRINKEINRSIETVRQLNMTYKELERTVSDAMGAEELRARRAEIANKKEELSELQRQMQLEQSKRSKDRDDDAIKQYQERIQDLQHDIQDLTTDITTTLLGGDIKSAAESFVSTWVDAWRQGEDVMSGLQTSFDDMIDTMISKSIASRLVANRLQKIWDVVDEITNEKSEGGAEVTMSELRRIKSLIGDKSISQAINEDLTRLYEALGIAYGSGADTDKNLSALQQGIQGITEDTAGALEAMLNGISQQIYLHSDILLQIKDAIMGFDMDVQTASLSQILLQLRSSYEIQMSIHSMLSGWSSPNGMSVRVEMI